MIVDSLDSLDVETLVAALDTGAAGAIATDAAGPEDLDRLAARLDVAESMLNRAAGTAVAGIVPADAAAVLACARATARPARASAIGLDEGKLAARLGVAAGGGAAAVASARGLVVLAAGAAGVTAFTVVGPDEDVRAAREAAAREGFAAVLVVR
ncbi:hypothetical protein [Oharaeibacter diazotrophicus]|uniref:hypothetical protein n=2 Tax=Oharaeibacter diazotrophicus TaxID=1920512 RepID=UPI000F819B42|nr:hypothetical protein [Oharaeibacter diazotrophicus]GLS76676.1 hypothetical protein GCM10007904_20130 [Oharaeibacter diazotrophicus]